MSDVDKLKEELAAANKAFDELSASSQEIEQEQAAQIKELESEVESLKKFKQEGALLRDRVEELNKRLVDQMQASEKLRQEYGALEQSSRDQIQSLQGQVVSLESELVRAQELCRAAEASSSRYQQRYESLLESSAVEKCELEELRMRVKESEYRAKQMQQEQDVVVVETKEKQEKQEKEGKEEGVGVVTMKNPFVEETNNNNNNNNNNDTTTTSTSQDDLRKELAFYKKLLNEVVKSLSKGTLSLPNAQSILSEI